MLRRCALIKTSEGNRKEIESHLRINSVDESIRTQHVECKFDVFHAAKSMGGQMPKMVSANASLLQSEMLIRLKKG